MEVSQCLDGVERLNGPEAGSAVTTSRDKVLFKRVKANRQYGRVVALERRALQSLQVD
jgi:hypothetical protein